jgi:hypothetical protein
MRSFMICTPHPILCGDKIEKNEMGGACSADGEERIGYRVWVARRTVPWWSEELTIMRKRLNALRRRFQRKKDNDELRTQRKIQYTEAKTNYTTKIRKAKSLSWREYYNMTTHINPSNEANRLVADKRKSTTLITTLSKPDGTLTEDLQETHKHMLEHFSPEDNQHDDSDLHKQTRTPSMEPIYTEDDRIYCSGNTDSSNKLGGKGTRSRRHHGGKYIKAHSNRFPIT